MANPRELGGPQIGLEEEKKKKKKNRNFTNSTYKIILALVRANFSK
jgi:hypothetical protein